MSIATDILRTVNQAPGSLASLTATNPTANSSASTASLHSSFAAAMQLHSKTGAKSAGEDSQDTTAASQDDNAAREAQAEKTAGDLISNALILPMLKQLRRSAWSENTPFSPGIGEKTFGPEFDMEISDRIAHSPRLGIQKALAQRLLRRGHPNAPSHDNTAATPSTSAPAGASANSPANIPAKNASLGGKLNVRG